MSGRIKVSNISKHVDSAILQKLFSFIGAVQRLDLHQSAINPEVQEALVEFNDASSVKVATFLSGTEVADRALIITEDTGMPSAANAAGRAAGQVAPMAGGTAHAMPLANPSVVAMMAAQPRNLHAIPANVAAIIHPSILQFDPVKAEEISRTIYVGNIASNVSEQQLMDFFTVCGPVAYVKMAGDGMQPTRFAFVEFADIATAQAALQMNGMMLAERPLKVNHSKNAINKPQRGIQPGVVAPVVPTLAATASLPSNVDPVAASLLAANASVQARLQQAAAGAAAAPVHHQPGAGLAWPVLGNTNPLSGAGVPNATSSAATATAAAAGTEDDAMMKRLRELQVHMEEKYKSHSRRRNRERSMSGHRSATRRERSPSAGGRVMEDSDDDRRRRESSRRRHSRSRSRRSPSSRRRGGSSRERYSRHHRDSDDEDDYYYARERRAGRRAGGERDRERDRERDDWYRRHREYRSRSGERHRRKA
ncbi:hypothetical protein GQ54DRAFT_266099 [Martensiomyces pterosporus]|nr:hypothetical protein GQ54DRAFT_266099 [Martensiomyces pterosporus]